MKTVLKIACFAALLAPVIASAQLINVSAKNTATVYSATDAFHNLTIAMTSDAPDLFTPEGSSLSLNTPISFTPTGGFVPAGNPVGDWTDGNGGAYVFEEIAPFPFFKLFGEDPKLEIGYIGNESDDDNELWVSSYATQVSAKSDQVKLFDYDAGDLDSVDDPPMSRVITLQDNVVDAFLQFTHMNMNPDWATSAHQDDPVRFKVWEVTNNRNEEDGRQFLMAISDRNLGFDVDRDDGFFFIAGDIAPVPEPSQIAGLAILGLGAIIFIRRRFTSKKK